MSLDMNTKNDPRLEEGVQALRQPILPLVQIVQFLFLTGPFETAAAILDELTEPIETNTAAYPDPASSLRPYLPEMENFAALKNAKPLPSLVLNEQLDPVGRIEAVELLVAQAVLTKELEKINSLLCGPCKCVLCCTGPDDELSQNFFEIPLCEEEKALFDVATRDTEESRSLTSQSETPLVRENKPFYETDSAIYHWQNGPSLILPKNSSCPNLDEKSGNCLVYNRRPDVCRRPQIFPYALERYSDRDESKEGKVIPASIGRRKLLAVWDCPYVRELKPEIAAYAEVCGLEPVFMENKV